MGNSLVERYTKKEMSRDSRKMINHVQYDEYYNKPDIWFRFRYRTRIKDLTCRYLIGKLEQKVKNGVIVELGFGHANILLSFSNSNKIIGSELSPSAIKNAKKKAVKRGFTNFLFYSIEEFPELSQVVKNADIVLASHVLEHIDDEVLFVNEAYKALKTGGHLIILIPLNELKEDPNHMRKYTVYSCRILHEKNGFKCLLEIENDHFFSILEKIYWGRSKSVVGSFYKVLWKLISIVMGCWSFRFYRFMDKIAKCKLSSRPHQVGYIFEKK